MRKGLFIGGVVLFMLGFLIWTYDQPKADLVSQGIGQLALLDEGVREQYRVLQEEIFLAKTMMAFGVIIMIPGIVLTKKSKSKISTKIQKQVHEKPELKKLIKKSQKAAKHFTKQFLTKIKQEESAKLNLKKIQTRLEELKAKRGKLTAKRTALKRRLKARKAKRKPARKAKRKPTRKAKRKPARKAKRKPARKAKRK